MPSLALRLTNDNHGHEIGDLLLICVASRITETLRATDTVARIGGDEFAAILPQIENESDISKVAELIIKKLSIPFELNGITVNISASIGISIYPKDGSSVKDLLQHADKAMYKAKKEGRARISFIHS